jgi:predicted O-methyltransferase YrrM
MHNKMAWTILENIKTSAYQSDFKDVGVLEGWMNQKAFTRLFNRSIKKNDDLVVIEVGSYKGLSTCHMAKRLKELGHCQSRIIAIDTWLGSPEHLETMQRDEFGIPVIYRHFINNVKRLKFDDVIYPFPISSVQGGHFLEQHKILADIIYIDAGHETESVALDAAIFWRLLRPGGTMIFDDYAWPSVAAAIKRFALENDLPLDVDESLAAIVKPL